MALQFCHHMTQHTVLCKHFSKNIAVTLEKNLNLSKEDKKVLRMLSQSKEELSKTFSAYVSLSSLIPNSA